MNTIHRILVPVDFSDSSHVALGWAALLAKRFGARIDVLHVWNPPTHVEWAPYYPIGLENLQLAAFERTAAGHAMKELLAELEQGTGTVVNGRIESGDPCKTILRIAQEEPYDLIVMGTHGRTGMSHLLLGSLAETVVRRAVCPVLTVRMTQPQLRAGRQPIPREEPEQSAEGGVR